MVSHQRKRKVQKRNANHGKKEGYLAKWRVANDPGFLVNSIGEQQRREQCADYEICDGQVCENEVECSMNGFVCDIGVYNHSIAESAKYDCYKIQRAYKRCCRGILLVEMHGLTESSLEHKNATFALLESKVGRVPVAQFRPSLLVICGRKPCFILGRWKRIEIMLSSAAQVNRCFRIVGRRKG